MTSLITKYPTHLIAKDFIESLENVVTCAESEYQDSHRGARRSLNDAMYMAKSRYSVKKYYRRMHDFLVDSSSGNHLHCRDFAERILADIEKSLASGKYV